MIVKATLISKPIMQFLWGCISYYGRNKLKYVTGGCINRNTVDMINIEFWLKILKGYRYFTSENKTTVSFLMKSCDRKVKNLPKPNDKAKRRD